ncbi:MAG: hypothetical protein ACYTGN_16460 [Planctomycetota bacterium]
MSKDNAARVVRYGLWGGVAICVLLAVVSFVRWRVDLGAIRERVGDAIAADATASEKMRQAMAYFDTDVGHDWTEDYYLLPVFGFMKPTARQVMEGPGGDCAYRARAYIVVLSQYGVEASKRAVYNADGRPVHAVVEVQTERGPYIADLLYDLIHEQDNGDPVPLETLKREAGLRDSLERATKRGHPSAARYPLPQYAFAEVRAINWEQSAPMKAMFAMLSVVMGEETVRNLPRPYLAEEPALMTIVVCVGGAGGCLVVLGVWALWRRRKRAPEAAT